MNSLQMKMSFVALVLALCLGLSSGLSAQDPGQNVKSRADADRVLGGGITITDGTCSVTLDSYGRTTNFNIGDPCGNIMYEHQDYISVNGAPVKRLDEACMIDQGITLLGPDHAVSQLRCGNLTIVFDHELTDCDWTTRVVLQSPIPTDICYYSYTDYDISGFANDSGTFNGSDFLVSACNSGCAAGFGTGGVRFPHFDQRIYPQLRNAIAGFQSCGSLNDDPDGLGDCPDNGLDWTGALGNDKLSVSETGNTLIYHHFKL